MFAYLSAGLYYNEAHHLCVYSSAGSANHLLFWSQMSWLSRTSSSLPPLMGFPGPCSRGFRCSKAPASPSHAPWSHSTKEVPSSSSSPPPTQRRTSPSQLSITPPTSCFLLQTTPTKETTPVFITSMFSPRTSPLRASLFISPSQVTSERI